MQRDHTDSDGNGNNELGKEDNGIDNKNGAGYDSDGMDPARVATIKEEAIAMVGK